MTQSGARRLAASVSLAALGIVLAQPAFAATTEGVRQEDSGTIAINLYEVGADEPDAVFGTTTTTSNPGGLATATAWVTCALSATCPNPGALEQFATGVESATNSILIDGLQRIEAVADALGETATVVAFIDTAVAQLAVSGGKALNEFDVSGTIEVGASAVAEGTDGPAIAQALVGQAIAIEAIGGTAATVDFDNDGLIEISAVAEAISGGTEAETAYARATAFGIAATAYVTGEGTALADIYNAGTIEVIGQAEAVATGGKAIASGVAILGIGAVADAAAGEAIARVENDGTILISALGDAIGGNAATGIAIGAGGIVAQAFVGTGDAFATVINDGNLLISADAHAEADTNALAYAAAATAIYQQAQAADGDAFASIVNNGDIVMQANADATALVAQATAVAGGAIFAGAIFQSAAAGNGTGEANFVNAGDIVMVADADAYGSVVAYANAFGGPDIQQLAFGTGGDAIASLVNDGSIFVAADAFAYATNSAFALASFVNAVNNGAFANGGDAFVDMVNSGEILVGANAVAEGGNVAGALAAASHLVGQFGFAFDGNANVLLDNDGAIALEAVALAQGDFASAQAFVTSGVLQNAFAVGDGSAAATIDNGGTIDIVAAAGASGVTAYATAAVVDGILQVASAHLSTFGSETLPDGTFVRTSTSTPSGPASVALINSGTIDIAAAAAATGEDYAEARATASGVLQFVSGSEAEALIDNQGSLSIGANAVAEANGAAVAVANVAGIAQVGTALANSTTETYLPGGTLTLELSSIPVGAVQLELTNIGDIAIVGAASAVAGEAGLGGLTEAVAYAGVAGIDQNAIGQTASALLDNGGTILIAAQADVVSAGLANGVALASGIDQAASAWASGGSAVFPPGATTPSTFTTFAYPVGPASVSLVNDGTITVLASVDASGQTAFGGATAQGVGQAAAGTVASASLDNSGSLTVLGRVESSGGKAFALGAGIGVVQGASATDQASISLDNSGDIAVAGIALADGETGGFANVTVFGFAQQAISSGVADIGFTNSGTIEIDALASGVGGVSAGAFIFASGLIQAGQGSSVDIDFLNEGLFDVDAVALAEAGDSAVAAATILGGIGQVASVGAGTADLSLVNDGTIEIQASAEAIGGVFASALASANGYLQLASAVETVTGTFTTPDGAVVFENAVGGAGTVSAVVDNSGSLLVSAVAAASGGETAIAGAIVDGGEQIAKGSSIEVVLTNSGTMAAIADVVASAENYAGANATASAFEQNVNATSIIQQFVDYPGGTQAIVNAQIPVGPAFASIDNGGDITVAAQAFASAAGNDGTIGGTGFANARVTGLAQYVWGSEALGRISNSGSLTVVAEATGNGEELAGSLALAQGVRQGVRTLGSTMVDYFTSGGSYIGFTNNIYYAGPAEVEFSNEGSIAVGAQASANAANGPASAAADARGISMAAAGTLASIVVENDGDLLVSADAVGSGTTGRVSAVAAGITQGFTTGTDLFIDIVNSGSIAVGAEAVAVQDNGATAIAAALGLSARGIGFEGATLAFENSGSLDVVAMASAEGGYFAGGTAFATGMQMGAFTPQANIALINSGDVTVGAQMIAVADGETGFAGATAFAHGALMEAADVTLDVSNDGSIEVVAVAGAEGASGWAWATAAGISVGALAGTTLAPYYGVIDGTIANAGTLAVFASAEGIVDDVDTRASSASALGIALYGGSLEATIENSGTIDVAAVIGSDDGIVSAIGILAGGEPGFMGEGALLTITNDGGTIIARESVDGGETWRRGMAIDVAASPNNTVINLIGDGSIYGNVALQDGDVINVADGTTYFDGIIGPAFVPEGGITEDVLDTGLAGVGSLIIGDGGNLVLADPRISGDPDFYDGPAYALVDTLTVEADGTLTFELQPEDGGAQDVGTYPQVFANTANLDGTLAVEFTAPGGLIADAYSYDNVIDADVRIGEFDQCVLAGSYEDSLLVGLECDYDGGANVDLTIERVAFDDVAGLNGNGAAVGSGLECIYDVSLTGGIADLLADLFLFSDPVNYTIALNQLSGSVYANYLQSFPSLGVHYNDILAKATDCEVPALAGSVLECRASAPLHLWGQADYQWRKADGDEEAGTAKSKRGSLVVGLDANVGAAGIIGGSIGYVTNNVRDSQFGDDADASGFQVGLYGVYDPGTFYLKGMTTYSWYDGDSERNINFAGLANGATFAASPDGDPDVNMWTFGLHGGMRFAMGGNSVLTPYLNYDYVNAKLKGFTETGGNGADLTVWGGRAKHSFLTGGVKWATQMGGVVPEVNLGYRHRFGDKRSDFSASFLGDAGCDFDIISAAQKKGTFLAGVSVGGKMGPVDLRIGYEGEFNSDITSHAANFKFVLPLGGRAAPPPPPVVAPPPPPPPPPPPVEEAPPPPPPPPPPAPERGQ